MSWARRKQCPSSGDLTPALSSQQETSRCPRDTSLPSRSPAGAGSACERTANGASRCAASRRPSRPRRTSPSASPPGSRARTCNRTSAAPSTIGSGRGASAAARPTTASGAGQQVAQVTFGGRDWRQVPEIAAQMFDVFAIVRQLHELLWYLTEALAMPAARPLHGELRAALQETERLAGGSPEALAALDVTAHRRDVNALLLRTSELARAGAGLTGVDHRGADLTGKDLSGADLAGASLRGTCLIGADLSGADLRGADFTGADLRGADLSGADLTGSIFLTQSQLDAAKGDPGTKLPPSLTYPLHWPLSAASGHSG